jgi:hypothetical protein
MFGYNDPRRFSLQKNAILNLSARLQNLAPGGRNNGPNPEYPWPPNLPTIGPLAHQFLEWHDWNETTAGGRLRYFVKNLLKNYFELFSAATSD